MADLQPCAACGHDVSPMAKTCPSCGHPVPNPYEAANTFGKIIGITCLVLALLVGVWWYRERQAQQRHDENVCQMMGYPDC